MQKVEVTLLEATNNRLSFSADILATYQQDLTGVSPLIDEIAAGKHPTLITHLFYLVSLYGLYYLHRRYLHGTPEHIHTALKQAYNDIAATLQTTGERVQDVLEEAKGQRKLNLAKLAQKIIVPAKHNNGAICCGEWVISAKQLKEIPVFAQ